MKPKYAIVRVDNNCPFYTELVTKSCWIYKNEKSCFNCKIKKSYGDTKEQLIMKIEQELNRYVYKIKLSEVARKIVEFLGVEE